MIDKKVKLNLVGVDSNAMAICGTFRKAALKQGWTPEEAQEVITEAKSGDYDHLLATIVSYCDDDDSDDDDIDGSY